MMSGAGLGGQLVPVAVELTRLTLDLQVGVGLHEGVDLRLGVLVAHRVAPPGQSHVGRSFTATFAPLRAAAPRTRSASPEAHRGSRSRQSPSSNEELPPVDGHLLFTLRR